MSCVIYHDTVKDKNWARVTYLVSWDRILQRVLRRGLSLKHMLRLLLG
jgi:hypothetical protein